MRTGSCCILVVGAFACVWSLSQSPNEIVSSVRADVFEQDDEPSAAVRMHASRPAAAPGRETPRGSSPNQVVDSYLSESVVATSVNSAPGQAGAPAPIAIAPRTEPAASEPPPSYDDLAARWVAEQSAEPSPGDGREFAFAAQLGVNPKMVLGAECRTSVCRVEVVIPWGDPDPEPSINDGIRAPDNPDPDRDITTFFYPRTAPASRSTAVERSE